MKLVTVTAFFLSGFLLAGGAAAQGNRNCTTCHGAQGEGNMSMQAPRIAGMEPWYMKHQLENFRAGIRGTHPEDMQGIMMQNMVAGLTDAAIEDAISWVGTFPYTPAPITITGDTTRGADLYRTCSACHGVEGEGNETFNTPALAGQNDWYLVNQLKKFKAGIRGSHAEDRYGKMMIQMAGRLTNDKAINDVVSYINTLGR